MREASKRATQQREMGRNELRKKVRVPMVSAWAIVRIADEEAAAVRRCTKRLREERQDRETRKEHVPLADMKCEWRNIRDANPVRLLQAKPQQGQVGWWIPTVNLRVEAFWQRKEGGNR